MPDLEGLPGSLGRAGIGEGFYFDPEIASMISELWQDEVMNKVMESSFYLMDSAQ